MAKWGNKWEERGRGILCVCVWGGGGGGVKGKKKEIQPVYDVLPVIPFYPQTQGENKLPLLT